MAVSFSLAEGSGVGKEHILEGPLSAVSTRKNRFATAGGSVFRMLRDVQDDLAEYSEFCRISANLLESVTSR